MRLWTKINVILTGVFLIDILFFYTQSCSLGIDIFSFIIRDITGFGFTGESIKSACHAENKFLVFLFSPLLIFYLWSLEYRSSPRTNGLNW